MQVKQRNIIEAKIEQVATQLQLPHTDPTLALYQAIEYFEAREFTSALPHFVIAAQHYHLHALPYINYLIKKECPLPSLDETTVQHLNEIKKWSCFADNIEVGHKDFLHTSLIILECQQLKNAPQTAKKSSKKKKNDNVNKKYDRKLKELLRESECGHRRFHQAMHYKSQNQIVKYIYSLMGAVNCGHLLAIAQASQYNRKPDSLTVFGKKILDFNYHKTLATRSFADRIFNTAVCINEPEGKRNYHFESVRLGNPHAFSLIAGLYFSKKRDAHDAIGLVMLGTILQDANARVLLVNTLLQSPSVKIPNYDLTAHNIIRLLLLNLSKQYYEPDFDFHIKVDYYEQVVLNTLSQLTSYIEHHSDNPEVYNHKELLITLESLFNEYPKLMQESKINIASTITNLLLKQICHGNDKATQVELGAKAILFAKYTFDKTNDVACLLDLFYISLEHYEKAVELNQLNNKQQVSKLNELIGYVQSIKKHLAKEFKNPVTFSASHSKYIDYSLTVLLAMFNVNSDAEKTYLDDYRTFIELAVRNKSPNYTFMLARYYAVGLCGYTINYPKARELLYSVLTEIDGSPDPIRLLSHTYLADENADSNKAIAIRLQYAKTFPEFYFEIAEYYCDGFIGIQPNDKLAKQYYLQAIDAGCSEGHVGLAIMLWDELKMMDDSNVANSLVPEILGHFKIACDDNSGDAAFFLGKVYLHGEIVQKNLDKAKQYFHLAIERTNQPYAKAFLAMMEQGFEGEQVTSLRLEHVRLTTLKESGYIDSSPFGMFDYALINLKFNPPVGIEYLIKSTQYNFLESQYLLATLQQLIDCNLSSFSPDIIKDINQKSYRHLFTKQERPARVNPFILNLFESTKLVKKYIDLEYPITLDYVLDIFDRFTSAEDISLADIEQDIKDQFPSEKVLKVKLLHNRFFSQERSGDEECRLATKNMFENKTPKQSSLSKKIDSLNQDSKISMKNLGSCLKAFLQGSVELSGEDKKKISAAQKMHPPHGRGDRNPDQDLEGGRKKTALEAFNVMKRNL